MYYVFSAKDLNGITDKYYRLKQWRDKYKDGVVVSFESESSAKAYFHKVNSNKYKKKEEVESKPAKVRGNISYSNMPKNENYIYPFDVTYMTHNKCNVYIMTKHLEDGSIWGCGYYYDIRIRGYKVYYYVTCEDERTIVAKLMLFFYKYALFKGYTDVEFTIDNDFVYYMLKTRKYKEYKNGISIYGKYIDSSIHIQEMMDLKDKNNINMYVKRYKSTKNKFKYGNHLYTYLVLQNKKLSKDLIKNIVETLPKTEFIH